MPNKPPRPFTVPTPPKPGSPGWLDARQRSIERLVTNRKAAEQRYYDVERHKPREIPAGTVLGGGGGGGNPGGNGPSPLLNGLVAYWKLDDLTDATGRGNTLTNNNAATFDTGIIGNAAEFVAASSQDLSRADNADLSTGEISYSISAWVYFASKAANMQIVAKDGSGQREYALWWEPTEKKIRFDSYNAAGTADGTTLALDPTLSTWYHIVVVRDLLAVQNRIYLNAGAPATSAITLIQSDTTSAFRIGGRSWGDEYFNGRIDEVGFWKKTLAGSEIASLYNGGAGLTYPFG